jgi:hypothetical protein
LALSGYVCFWEEQKENCPNNAARLCNIWSFLELKILYLLSPELSPGTV